jgi:epsin
MDLLKDAAKNLNLYEVKSYVRKAQNVAMNLTEMESKVREATNNEPWGASTTLMSQIAAGTYNYREREEIIAFTFRRFTEKAANEWRQIYKSLQLLDYLIKNGSERIIDDVRANISLIQMLKSFHYIDSKGRDQGINVRNRAKTLIALLNDDALIRSERKKARANAKKFGGVSSAAYGGASSVGPSGGRNFDDDYNNRVFGDGGVYGARYDDTAAAYNEPNSSPEEFEEYNENTTSRPSGTSKATTSSSKVNAKASTNPPTKEPETDLLGDLLDFEPKTQASGSSNQAASTPGAADDDDDDFDDFQAAPSNSTTTPLSNNLAGLYQTQPQAHNPIPSTQPTFNAPTVNYNVNTSVSTGPAKPAPSNDAFSSLFSSAKTKSKTTSTPHTPTRPAQDTTSNFTSNTNANASNNNANTASGEMDLLSF